MSQETQNYVGTPTEVGFALASDALLPTIRKGVEAGMTEAQAIGMLTGIALFACGTAAMAVGHSEAIDMMRKCIKHLETNPPAAVQ